MKEIRLTPRQRRLVLILIHANFGERVVARALGYTRAEVRRHFNDVLAAARAERRGPLPGADISRVPTFDQLVAGSGMDPFENGGSNG